MKSIKEGVAKARERPLLIDTIYNKKQATNLAKMKATEDYINVLKSEGLDPKDHLTEEQKELLAEKEYLERRKKELGRP